jgi:hypothetical protein
VVVCGKAWSFPDVQPHAQDGRPELPLDLPRQPAAAVEGDVEVHDWTYDIARFWTWC